MIQKPIQKPATAGPGTAAVPDRVWRADLTALQFVPTSHRGFCVVHRLAFRTLLGFDPTEADCLAYFDNRPDAFQQAAHAKIARRALAPANAFHLNSRDIRRALSENP